MEGKIIKSEQFRFLLRDKMSIMFGGILDVGTPQSLVSEIIKSGIRDLTLIGNDISFAKKGIGSLILNGQVEKVIVSQIIPDHAIDYSTYCQIELSPKSTLAERIRCGANGFGGFLTRSGIGTDIESGKQQVEVAGITYLIERPLRADLAIIQAFLADVSGNLVYNRKARGLNPVIAGAADIIVAECESIIPFGGLDQRAIITTGAFVDYLYAVND